VEAVRHGGLLLLLLLLLLLEGRGEGSALRRLQMENCVCNNHSRLR
jgi:hypothetical protein